MASLDALSTTTPFVSLWPKLQEKTISAKFPFALDCSCCKGVPFYSYGSHIFWALKEGWSVEQKNGGKKNNYMLNAFFPRNRKDYQTPETVGGKKNPLFFPRSGAKIRVGRK